MLKYPAPLRRRAVPGLIAALLIAPPVALANEASALAELKAIRAMTAHADTEAARRIAMVRLSLPPDASPLLRRELENIEARVTGCAAPGAMNAAAALAAAAAAQGTPGAPSEVRAVGKPALGVPAFGTTPARAPGLHGAQPGGSRAAATMPRAQRLRLLATTLAAVAAAALAGAAFIMYRRSQDKSERLAQLDRVLNDQARRDPLTRLQNRRAFVDKMADRAESMPLNRTATDCISLINIDHFRLVNDRLGHDVGDAVLAEIGRRLHKVVRDSDMLVRWGGEEFLVFSPDAHPQQMRKMLERVMGAVGSTPVQVDGHSIPVTISVGLAHLPFAGIPEFTFDWQKVVSLADKALHLAKQQGRNRAVAVAGLSGDHDAAMAALETDFGRAIEQGMVETISVPGPSGAQVKQLHPA
ncbi:GGDEF domain-containing protein [Massilia soli]|uniref:diguanylate cyclase n=1 Tax=Massilia soli TaxID=2792854 RepID=A0ABS7STI7_9BURK|nr:GGDEF domain-containing protein [Massilia soli]MBZ2209257.1 GGDEF domain-containing protein [Massilia soli]